MAAVPFPHSRKLDRLANRRRLSIPIRNHHNHHGKPCLTSPADLLSARTPVDGSTHHERGGIACAAFALLGGIRNKAACGALRRGPPIMFVWGDEDGDAHFHSDEAVYAAICVRRLSPRLQEPRQWSRYLLPHYRRRAKSTKRRRVPLLGRALS